MRWAPRMGLPTCNKICTFYRAQVDSMGLMCLSVVLLLRCVERVCAMCLYVVPGIYSPRHIFVELGTFQYVHRVHYTHEPHTHSYVHSTAHSQYVEVYIFLWILYTCGCTLRCVNHVHISSNKSRIVCSVFQRKVSFARIVCKIAMCRLCADFI